MEALKATMEKDKAAESIHLVAMAIPNCFTLALMGKYRDRAREVDISVYRGSQSGEGDSLNTQHLEKESILF
jgi:hypothetical protein